MRWNHYQRQIMETPAVDAFIEEVVAVSKRHGMSISHEDTYGAFVIENYSDRRSNWLRAAFDATTPKQEEPNARTT